MEFKLDIDPEVLKAQIVQGVAQSLVGEAIVDVIKATCRIDAYDSPVKRAIHAVVEAAVKKVVAEVYMAKIEEQVRAYLTAEVMGPIVENTTRQVVQKLTRD